MLLNLLFIPVSIFLVILGCVLVSAEEVRIGYGCILSAALLFPPIRKHLNDTPFASVKATVAAIVFILALGVSVTVYKNPGQYHWPVTATTH